MVGGTCLSVHPCWSISLLPRAEAELAEDRWRLVREKGVLFVRAASRDAPPPMHSGRRRSQDLPEMMVGMVRCADGQPRLAVVDRPRQGGRGGEGGLGDGVAPAGKGIVIGIAAPGAVADDGRQGR